jgi:hypothetical protein
MALTSYTAVSEHVLEGQNDPSDPLTQPTSGSPPRSRWTAWTQDGWLFEIASTALGILLIVILAVVLRIYNHQEVGRFGTNIIGLKSGLSLNTLVAILSTASKAALLFPVAQCISQFKWIWFYQKSRKLSDFSAFDNASRGIWGSLELARGTRLR